MMKYRILTHLAFLPFLVSCPQNKGMRFVKNVGLGFKTPKSAREGNYVDKKCPFTGDVSIRGRILKVTAPAHLANSGVLYSKA